MQRIRDLPVATLLATAVALLVAPPLQAQIFGDTASTGTVEAARPEHEPWGGRFGLALGVAQPVGEFRQYVDNGIGGILHGVFPLGARGALGLRAAGEYVVYGNETSRAYYSGIPLDVETSNNILTFDLGPQLTATRGAVRPYVNGSVGLTYFFTQSSLKSVSTGESYDSRTRHGDWTAAWSAGGGLYIPLTSGASVIELDVGARYRNNGRASYLRESSIRDDNGQITYEPVESLTNLVVYQVGVTIRGR